MVVILNGNNLEGELHSGEFLILRIGMYRASYMAMVLWKLILSFKKNHVSPPTNDSYRFIVIITIAEEAEMASSIDHGCHF